MDGLALPHSAMPRDNIPIRDRPLPYSPPVIVLKRAPAAGMLRKGDPCPVCASTLFPAWNGGRGRCGACGSVLALIMGWAGKKAER